MPQRRGVSEWRAAIYRHPGLSNGARVAALWLADHMRADRTVSVPQKRIADALGITPRRVRERLAEVTDAGLLDVVVKAQPRTTAVYQGTFGRGADVRPPEGPNTAPLRGADVRRSPEGRACAPQRGGRGATHSKYLSTYYFGSPDEEHGEQLGFGSSNPSPNDPLADHGLSDDERGRFFDYLVQARGAKSASKLLAHLARQGDLGAAIEDWRAWERWQAAAAAPVTDKQGLILRQEMARAKEWDARRRPTTDDRVREGLDLARRLAASEDQPPSSVFDELNPDPGTGYGAGGGVPGRGRLPGHPPEVTALIGSYPTQPRGDAA